MNEESIVPITLTQEEARNVLFVEGAVDIATAAELKQMLLSALENGRQLHVSFAAETELDVTAIQLFWAGAREASNRSIGFSLDGPLPQTVARALADGGVEKFPLSS